MFELVLSEPLHALEESLGDREQIEELEEPGQRFLVVSDDLCPSDLGRVFQVDLVRERGVTFDGADAGDDGGDGQSEEKGCNNQLSHDIFITYTHNTPQVICNTLINFDS